MTTKKRAATYSQYTQKCFDRYNQYKQQADAILDSYIAHRMAEPWEVDNHRDEYEEFLRIDSIAQRWRGRWQRAKNRDDRDRFLEEYGDYLREIEARKRAICPDRI